MRIFLSARYGRRLELCGYRDDLVAMGHTVTSRWMDGRDVLLPDGSVLGDLRQCAIESNTLHDDGSTRAELAGIDIEDIMGADVFVNFTEPPDSDASRGGRHVELGMVLAHNLSLDERTPGWKLVIIVGYRENLFHWLPYVSFCKTWEDAKRILG